MTGSQNWNGRNQEPGWGKVAWALSVDPYLDGSTVSIELRISTTDKKSWKKLWRYYRLIGPFSYQIRNSMMKHLQQPADHYQYRI